MMGWMIFQVQTCGEFIFEISESPRQSHVAVGAGHVGTDPRKIQLSHSTYSDRLTFNGRVRVNPAFKEIDVERNASSVGAV